jgi:hypothetical protein
MSSRLTARSIVNAYFTETGYLKPGVDFWKSLNFRSRQKWQLYIKTVRSNIGEGGQAAQVAALTELLPADLGANVAKIWAANPKLKQFLASKLPPLAGAPPVIAEQRQLAIESLQPPVKGASEASLTSSSSVAVVPSSRDPEDGDDEGSFVGGKRTRPDESFSTLQATNNVCVEAEPKRQSVR